MFFNYLKKKIRTITEDKSVFYQSGGGEGGGGGGGGIVEFKNYLRKMSKQRPLLADYS